MPRLIIPGDYQAQASKFLPYDTTALEFWGMFGANSGRSVLNHAPGKAGATMIGTPAYTDNDMTVTAGANFLQTASVQTPDQTFIAVVRMPDDAAGNRHIVSNNTSPSLVPPPVTARGAHLNATSGSTVGDNLLTLEMNVSVNNAGTDVATNASLANNMPSAAWQCIASRYDSATKSYKVFNLTTGASATNTSALAANLGTAPFRIGSNYTTPGSTSFRIAMAAIYSAAKSDVEVNALYAKLQAYYAKRGMTI